MPDESRYPFPTGALVEYNHAWWLVVGIPVPLLRQARPVTYDSPVRLLCRGGHGVPAVVVQTTVEHLTWVASPLSVQADHHRAAFLECVLAAGQNEPEVMQLLDCLLSYTAGDEP